MLQWYRDLSFSYKIPLRAVALLMATAILFTLAFIALAKERLKDDLQSNGIRLGSILSMNIAPLLMRDDVWQIYELIESVVQSSAVGDIASITVIDRQHRVVISSEPKQYQMLSKVSEISEIAHSEVAIMYAYPQPYLIYPIVHDEVPIGYILIHFNQQFFLNRYGDVVGRSLIVAFLILLILLPVSIVWGRRMAKPLVMLTRCIDRLGERSIRDIQCQISHSQDEIGLLFQALQKSFMRLEQVEALEKEFAMSQKLSALGRLSAGIAHEINNPLGGMLTAIDTQRRFGVPDTRIQKTLSILERGLLQIRDIVAALLVDVKVGSRHFSQQDIDDIMVLVEPSMSEKHQHIHWHLQPYPLPEIPYANTHIRQVLFNLLLNAIQSSPPKSAIDCYIQLAEDLIEFRVSNPVENAHISNIEQFFEPHVSMREEGHGLGLWITYQVVQQLGGRIQLNANEDSFEVEILLPDLLVTKR